MEALPSPDTIDLIAKILERLAIPPALASIIALLVWLIFRRERRQNTTAPMSDVTQQLQELRDRVTKLEAIQEDRWTLVRTFVIPSLKQPTHLVMDYLLDKMAAHEPMSLIELETLQHELETRLRETEPHPGYHLKCRDTLELVYHEQRLERSRRDAQVPPPHPP